MSRVLVCFQLGCSVVLLRVCWARGRREMKWGKRGRVDGIAIAIAIALAMALATVIVHRRLAVLMAE